jgi:hypothetical protein
MEKGLLSWVRRKKMKKVLNRKICLPTYMGGRKSESEGKREILLIGWHHITEKEINVLHHLAEWGCFIKCKMCLIQFAKLA